MHLKSVTLQGFKSFATKTTIEFNQSITAIVGPNGSGKSNITDAIMWVLGETSAKSLRGSKMEDVIFSGTDKRRPLGFAEVVIVFDNTDRQLDLDYSEVSVTRRMYRSLESEFLINNTKCRLKDIKSLFMDTGIGKDGYSLIGQGKVESILSDRPEDRRAVFEEAAGISKFKYKKNQSQKKLLKTEENLIRLNDIILEIEQQADRLREQSQIANKYLEIYNELKKKEVNYLYNKTKNTRWELDQSRDEIHRIENTIYVLQEEIAENQRLENRMDLLLEEKEKEIEKLKERSDFYQQKTNHNSSSIEIFLEKNRSLSRDISRLQQQREKNEHFISLSKDHLKKLEKQVEELEEDSQKLAFDRKQKEHVLEKLQKEIEIYEKNHQEYQKEQMNLRAVIENITFKKETLRNILAEKKERSISLQSHIDQLLQNEEDYKKTEKKLSDKCFNRINMVKKLESKLQSIVIEEDKVGKLEEAKRNQMLQIQRKMETLKTKLNLEQNLANNYEGFNKSVKSFMNYCKKRKLFEQSLFGPVATKLEVPKEFEQAISVALGGASQNIIVNTDKDAKEMIHILEREKLGRVTFLPINRVKGSSLDLNLEKYKDKGVIGRADDLIHFDPIFKDVFSNLLGRILIVDTFENASRLSAQRWNKFRLVTLKGDLFHISGSITGGSIYQGGVELLKRQKEIEQLKVEVSTTTAEYNETLRYLTECENKLKEYHIEKESLLTIINRDKNKLIELNQSIDGIKQSITINTEYLNRYQKESESLQRSLHEDASKMRVYEEEMTRISNQIKASDTPDTNEDLENKKDKVKILQQEIINIGFSLKELSEKKNYSIQEKNRVKSEVDTRKLEMENWLDEIKSHQDQERANEEKVEVLKSKYSKHQIIIEDSRKKIKQEQNTRGDLINELKDLRDQNNRLRDQLMEKSGSFEKLKNKIERKEEFISDSYHKLYTEYHVYRVEISDYIEKQYEKTTEGEVKKLKSQLNHLGNVNLSSIDEYKKISERLEFNRKQRDDLMTSREEILNILKELDLEMKRNFKKSFHEIDAYFNEIFAILFHGGKASIEIEGNVLEGGIEIKAQPPGKRFQSLSLLSGGERSLTAVALLFALLKARPAPFCILDEIDAALDDANIKRYVEYLQLIKDIQFIIITHRKLTMEIANVMYGITMEEKGISKIFSVELNE